MSSQGKSLDYVRRRRFFAAVALCLQLMIAPLAVMGQQLEEVPAPAETDEADVPEVRPPVVRPRIRRRVYTTPELSPTPEAEAKVQSLVSEILLPEATLDLDPNQSKLIRFNRPVSRVAITDPNIVDFTEFSPTEFEVIGGQEGHTTVTLWFGAPGEQVEVLRYLVRVGQDEEVPDLDRSQYGDLQERINELFPNSYVQLIPVLDKLIVRGQARDSAEAARILGMLSGQATDQAGRLLGPGSLVNLGPAARLPGEDEVQARNLINLLQVPGEQQIMLKVRVAELTRSALRSMGVDLEINRGEFQFSSLLGTGGAFSAVLDTADVTLALQAITTNSYSKILAEPNLVTQNGQSASFVAGGQFAVPTVVGVGGVGAVSTSFQNFGTQLTFFPTIIDKDRIRLSVTPTFSTVNQANAVNGIPGLNTRTVTTTVDLREGQWLAIAGLLEDVQGGSKVRVPVVGDIPFVGTLFSRRTVEREETELLILVSPEFVHPLEAEEVPLILPGMEVTEPNDWDFFAYGRYEGDPECQHRSTVWPIQKERIFDAHWQARRAAKQRPQFQQSQEYYVHGAHGFSR